MKRRILIEAAVFTTSRRGATSQYMSEFTPEYLRKLDRDGFNTMNAKSIFIDGKTQQVPNIDIGIGEGRSAEELVANPIARDVLAGALEYMGFIGASKSTLLGNMALWSAARWPWLLLEEDYFSPWFSDLQSPEQGAVILSAFGLLDRVGRTR